MTYSLRSWWGLALLLLIAVPRVIQLVLDPGSMGPLDAVALVGALAAAGWIYAARLVLTDQGIERHPGRLRIAWDDIDELQALPRTDRVLGVRVVLKSGRKIVLTPTWLPPKRGAFLLDEVDEALSGSRSR